MRRLKTLTFCHNHPSLHPGGTEHFALDLFRHLKESGQIEGLFVGCANRIHRQARPGTVFQGVGRSEDELILWAGQFDLFFQSRLDLSTLAPDLGGLLQVLKPQVVHFHHSLLLGVEMLFLTRRLLPNARLVFTLHDYYPICAQDGQMVKSKTMALCHRGSPEACHGCFPDIGADRFLMREKHIKGLFGLVDQFVAPSHFLRDRYIDWGLPAERITVIPNGIPLPSSPAVSQPPVNRPPVFGLFGNLTPYKGVLVALEAAKRLRDAGQRFELRIHGGMAQQAEAFQAEITAKANELADCVSLRGPYERAAMPALLADVDWVMTPSVWWENAPLTILEAFQAKRPVIASNIGGMAELIADGVSGLLVPPSDPVALAAAMRRTIETPTLKDQLAAGIPAVPSLADCALDYLSLYRLPQSRRRSRTTIQSGRA